MTRTPRATAALPANDPSALDRLDFTTIPDLREPLWQVLPANPVFFRGGDFRDVMRRVSARIARQARQSHGRRAAADDGAPTARGPSAADR